MRIYGRQNNAQLFRTGLPVLRFRHGGLVTLDEVFGFWFISLISVSICARKANILILYYVMKGKGLSHNRSSRWPKGVRVG